MDLTGRNFLTLKDFSPDEITYMLDLAADLKEKKKKGIPVDIHRGNFPSEAQCVVQCGGLIPTGIVGGFALCNFGHDVVGLWAGHSVGTFYHPLDERHVCLLRGVAVWKPSALRAHLP